MSLGRLELDEVGSQGVISVGHVVFPRLVQIQGQCLC